MSRDLVVGLHDSRDQIDLACVFFVDERLELVYCEVMLLEVSPDECFEAFLRVEHFLSRDFAVCIHEFRGQIAMSSVWEASFDQLLEAFFAEGRFVADGLPDEGIAAFFRVELFRMHCSRQQKASRLVTPVTPVTPVTELAMNLPDGLLAG